MSSQTPAEDDRWKAYNRAYRDLHELGPMGLLLVPSNMGSKLTALQAISDGRAPHVRLNGAVRGVLWAEVWADWIEIGWELPADEREVSSHITVLAGHRGDKVAALVFHNMNPSILRAASDDRMHHMLARSIGVKEASEWWKANRYLVSGDEVLSVWGQAALVEHRHPDTVGSRIIDLLKGQLRSEGTLKRDWESLLSEDQERTLAADAPDADDISLRLDLEREVARLSDRHQEILRRYALGDTDAEIGHALGISQQAVNKARLKALDTLKKRLT